MGNDFVEVWTGYLLSPKAAQAFERHLNNIYPGPTTKGTRKANEYLFKKRNDLSAETEEEENFKDELTSCQFLHIPWPPLPPQSQIRAQYPSLRTNSALRMIYAELAEDRTRLLFATRRPVANYHYLYDKLREQFTEGPTEPNEREKGKILTFLLSILPPGEDTDPPFDFVTTFWNKPDQEPDSDAESDQSDSLDNFGLVEIAKKQAADENM